VICASQAAQYELLPTIDGGRSSFGSERHERDVPGTLNRDAELALMSCTVTGDPARNDFSPLSNQVAQAFDIFIVNIDNFI
jgi:hypothetical protein